MDLIHHSDRTLSGRQIEHFLSISEEKYVFGELGSYFHDLLFWCYWGEVVMSHMEDVFMIVDVFGKWLDVDDLVYGDWDGRPDVIEIFAEFIVSLVVWVER